MNCTHCQEHSCRKLGECTVRQFDRNKSLQGYHEPSTQEVVQAAAHLVDNGRGGTLNRLEEIIEYSLDRGYIHLGLAYCWSMEKDVAMIAELIRKRGLQVSAVSCTTGGFVARPDERTKYDS
jgi:uncharacterized metal-binding protein